MEDLDALQAFHAIEAAAHAEDFVALPADPIEELVPNLVADGKTGNLPLMYLGSLGGEAVGTLTVTLYTLDNLTSANVDLTVHPAHRRRGFARTLLTYGLAEARRHGRTRIFMEIPSGPDDSDGAAVPLMRQVGARPVLDDFRRVLDLQARPVGEPSPVPDGYRLVQWIDQAPEEIVAGAAYLSSRMTLDAPMGAMDYEREKWDPARYREKEASAMARHRTRFATGVVHAESGALAGITDIGVNRDHPQIAYQWDTIVDPAHRGHRLGLVLKSWNHRLLTEKLPGVAFINTWNAASNTFMIAVNDALGFRPAERWTEYQLDLPAPP